MPFTLLPIPVAQLRELAQSIAPTTLTHEYDEAALPPAFVAARSVAQIDAGRSTYWCSTFYVVRDSDNRKHGVDASRTQTELSGRRKPNRRRQ